MTLPPRSKEAEHPPTDKPKPEPPPADADDDSRRDGPDWAEAFGL